MGSTIILEDYLWLECEICGSMFCPSIDAEGAPAYLDKCSACRRGDPPIGAIDDMCEEPEYLEWLL